ncbi:MAG TPA: GTPase domain-containing protein, partial [Acidimicrobiia bacterium]|nr:GTPase domain-containing protein [Acidimicrobiia bacterium]
ANLGAPLVVVIMGSTGSGKSSLFNALAGRPLSPSGVLRPTTRVAKALAHPGDQVPDLTPGRRSGERVEVVVADDARPGLVVVDAPDFDSVEVANRALAEELLEAADLVVFVTTATRYADEVPWTILARGRERGVPLLAVINRLPESDADAAAVVEDYRRMLDQGRLISAGAFGDLEVVPVVEGAVDPSLDSLDRAALVPLLDAFDRLLADETARRRLARRAVAAALSGLPAAVEEVATEVDQEAAAAADLLARLHSSYREMYRDLWSELSRGTFLRAEVLRQWQDFVGAGQVARVISTGVGRIATALRGMFRPDPPPAALEVREAAFADLVAVAIKHADRAAARTAGFWSEDRFGAEALARDHTLWGASAGMGEALEKELEEWAADLNVQIRVLGERRRGWAQAATIGVNVLGTSAILAVFVHTGGLTGTEVGIAAATAMVNQALLAAIFGEANVAAFVTRAREKLGEILERAMAAERDRFEQALAPLGTPADLAARLRTAVAAALEASPS